LRLFSRILAVLISIICIGSIIYGYLHWTEKVHSPGDAAEIVVGKENVPADEETVPLSPLTLEELKAKSAGLPAGVQESMVASYQEGESVSMLVVGSAAMGTKESGWGALLKEKLQGVYGKEFLPVDLVGFKGTSVEFVEEFDRLSIGEGYDIVLFEPFTLADNGNYSVERNHENIMIALGRLKEANPDVQLILTPPQPIYEAAIYPRQVEDLAKFAEENAIPYVNHWASWPDGKDEALKEYLDEESNPNEAGAEVWAEALFGYFVKE
jgi:hypothetical protein